ncbi:uncharacterized protein FFB20_13349 [Fusarium fujikuroi]|nr:uncharacterized protein Y057_7351 [Fusarium fujikuroi]SCO03420.1 uncharacterized protein FFC1_09313 [Fusarium fujikuroi]SCO09671.1 uncharacterized protein FFB20_13349 [Fusarium fujikuroi]SCO35575.1 uncharacterized protein FFNC_04591 [Fusarium fujikuroi]VTT74758.1 unnamed protein product [Fusarium fujikuroi]
MLSLQGLGVLMLLGVAEGIPRSDESHQEPLLKHHANIPRDNDVPTDMLGAMSPQTDYRTMPAGTYTETISTSLVRIIVVNEPTPTTGNQAKCPVECDCTRIKDKNSDEYAQCLTNAACRPCREPNLTASSTIKPKATACPAECDCTKIKDEQSQE